LIAESLHETFIIVSQGTEDCQKKITEDIGNTTVAPKLESCSKAMLEGVASSAELDGPDFV
jgi:hypothetical protein